MAAYNRKDYLKAVSYLLEATKRFPSLELHLTLADCYWHLRSYTGCRRAALQAVEVGGNPQLVSTARDLAHRASKMKQATNVVVVSYDISESESEPET